MRAGTARESGRRGSDSMFRLAGARLPLSRASRAAPPSPHRGGVPFLRTHAGLDGGKGVGGGLARERGGEDAQAWVLEGSYRREIRPTLRCAGEMYVLPHRSRVAVPKPKAPDDVRSESACAHSSARGEPSGAVASGWGWREARGLWPPTAGHAPAAPRTPHTRESRRVPPEARQAARGSAIPGLSQPSFPGQTLHPLATVGARARAQEGNPPVRRGRRPHWMPWRGGVRTCEPNIE
eukprot:6480426-Prymnesium_polylepis.3